MKNFTGFFLLGFLLLVSRECRAEAPKALFVLPSTDTTEFNLGGSLQNALAGVAQETQSFNVQLASYAIPGFTAEEVAKAFQAIPGSEVLSFVYLEPERISAFLFDAARPQEFIVVAQGLIDPMLGNSVTPEVIEYKFRVAVSQLFNQYVQGQFQPLPGSQVDKVLSELSPDDPKRRADESRKLFRELASLEEKTYYLGANVGMVRVGGETVSGDSGSSSTINFGGFFGAKVSESIKAELGINIFNYSMMYMEGRYILPIAEKYITMNVTLGIGRVLSSIAEPRDTSPVLKSGQMVFGPGISFDVPLLGANIRGELKFYLGGGTIILGTYGITYSI